MSGSRPAAGGGRLVDVAPGRLTGWVTRFAAGHGGMTEPVADPAGVDLVAADGSEARIAVPYPPMTIGRREPLEAVLDHVAGIGEIGLLLFRAGAHSVGLCRDGLVTASSTDTHYVQGRTAAGGWSQQRYARRRGNQLDAAQDSTIGAAVRVLSAGMPRALLVGGDQRSLGTILEDPRLHTWAALPRRKFPDIVEPRRVVLDDVARRSLDLTVTVHNA